MSLEAAFASLEDPCREQGRLHKLIDIIGIAFYGVISGCETWVDIADFAQDSEAWLKQFLELPNGIPSHDTFARVFQLLDPKCLQACYQTWIASLHEAVTEDRIAVDGKTMCSSHDGYHGKSAVHMLHAWLVEAGLVLAAHPIDAKTNEIPEIREILKLLHLQGCIVTLDAMGCQNAIVQALLHDHQADYVIALKGNQGQLHRYVQDHFGYADQHHPCLLGGTYARHEQIGKPRGVVERRVCEVIEMPLGFANLRDQGWIGLRSMVRIQYAHKHQDAWITTQTRYYITSLGADAQQLHRCVRQHWHVENKCHRVLDVTFRQDDSRIRIGHSPENFAMLQHIALGTPPATSQTH
jgi:predicted transposase YbfD/YdcC